MKYLKDKLNRAADLWGKMVPYDKLPDKALWRVSGNGVACTTSAKIVRTKAFRDAVGVSGKGEDQARSNNGLTSYPS